MRKVGHPTRLRLACLFCCAATAAMAAQPTFLSRRDYALASGGGIAVADFNGDGIPDVVGMFGADGVAVLFGDGKGTLTPGPTSATGIYFYSSDPAAADLNGDGAVDLVTAGGQGVNGPYGIGVSFGNGDGTFQTAVFYQTGSDKSLGNVLLADFNGDGIPDVAVAAESGLWLFTGKGGGAFNSGILTEVAGTGYDQIAVADLNGDGNLDVAVTTATGFSVLFGNGDGSFQSAQAYPSPSGMPGDYIAAAPLVRAHSPDVVLSYQLRDGPASSVATYRNNGSGGLAPPIRAYLPGGSFTIGDVNGDGIPDLVSGAGYVALGNGNGTLSSAHLLSPTIRDLPPLRRPGRPAQQWPQRPRLPGRRLRALRPPQLRQRQVRGWRMDPRRKCRGLRRRGRLQRRRQARSRRQHTKRRLHPARHRQALSCFHRGRHHPSGWRRLPGHRRSEQ